MATKKPKATKKKPAAKKPAKKKTAAKKPAKKTVKKAAAKKTARKTATKKKPAAKKPAKKKATKKKTAAKKPAARKTAKKAAAKKKPVAKKKAAKAKKAPKKVAKKAIPPKPTGPVPPAKPVLVTPKNKITKQFTQTELFDSLQGSCGFASRREAKEFFGAFTTMVQTALKSGYRVPLPGLGKMQVRRTKARKGRNPMTQEVIQIPARKKVRFTVAKALKDGVL